MPLYEKKCEMCGYTIEGLYTSKECAEDSLDKCPNCDDLLIIPFPAPALMASWESLSMLDPRHAEGRRKQCGVDN